MDFEYRIFKFVPQVDRFVNEQMQFKLQECSYNKASTFEIDDDYADDYDFGLYQGDRSKARKHADSQMVPTQGITWLFSCPDIIPNNINPRQERR